MDRDRFVPYPETPRHLEDEFTKFSFASQDAYRKGKIGNRVHGSRTVSRCSREESSYRLDERSRGGIINGALASILPLSGAKMPGLRW